MRVASLDVFVWLIIFVMVALAKGWSKLQKQIDADSSESKEDATPIAPVQRRPTMREGARALQPQRARPQPPRVPVPRTAQPAPRPVSRTAPRPVGSPAPREGWRIDPEQIRRFVEQLSGQPQSTPQPPVAPPPIHKAPPPASSPTPEPAAALTETKPAMTEAAAPSTGSRASQWAEALRDKQNIRNIIISAEIIGPPKACL